VKEIHTSVLFRKLHLKGKSNYFWSSIIGNSRAILEVGLNRKANCSIRRWKHSLTNLAKNSNGCIKQDARFLASRMCDNSLIERNLVSADDGELLYAGLQCLPEMDHKIITIVFWDIQGFSALCYSLEITPALLILFLKEFFEAATKAILEQGGVVDKFLGDGVMALFGTHSNLNPEVENSAIRAAIAALNFRKQFEIMELKWKKIWQGFIPYQVNIGLKCGINTGCATVGNLGTNEYRYLTAFGLSVNLANRLARLARSNEILVSATTKSKIFEKFELLEKGIVGDMKNIPGRFEVFSVVREK
jgi:class 3 adenylate cyclase